ncbi:MAG: hypothetical protein KBD48_03350 [Candidatus Pacebacteria bacterium]|nr:hypothetical protein [Candidatus Paceibacterota bacterium]MBP9716196.1 hypothetical protein [Candidatus Paceibacterota bacterium]
MGHTRKKRSRKHSGSNFNHQNNIRKRAGVKTEKRIKNKIHAQVATSKHLDGEDSQKEAQSKKTKI